MDPDGGVPDPGGPRRAWPRLLTEAAVIVASILLAFSVDAWWDGRQEAEARQALFDALVQDMAAARIELERVRGYHGRGLDAARAFMNLRDEDVTAADAARVDQLIGTALLGGTFDAPTGAAQAVISGGDLSYVNDVDLVTAVTALLARVADVDREQSKLLGYTAQLRALLGQKGIDTSDVLNPREVTGGDQPWRRRTTEAWRLVDDPEIRSYIGVIYLMYNNTLAGLRNVEASLEQIQELAASAGN